MLKSFIDGFLFVLRDLFPNFSSFDFSSLFYKFGMLFSIFLISFCISSIIVSFIFYIIKNL